MLEIWRSAKRSAADLVGTAGDDLAGHPMGGRRGGFRPISLSRGGFLAVEPLAPLLGFFVAAACLPTVAVGQVAQDGGAPRPPVAKGVGGTLEFLDKLMLRLAAGIDRFRDDAPAVVLRCPHAALDGPAVESLQHVADRL